MHHDEVKKFKDLNFHEKLNTICNKKAKMLITNENRLFALFPFTLHSPFIQKDDLVFSKPKQVYNTISLHYCKDYYLKKHSLQVDKIDWQSRERAYQRIPPYLH